MTQLAKWVSDPWLGFDTETTGVSTSTDRLVTAATVVRLGGYLGTDPDQAKTWLADPGVEIPAVATSVHGISTEKARLFGSASATVIGEVAQVLAAHMKQGYPIVIFNASFDLPLLQAEATRHGVEGLAERLGGVVAPVLDPLVLDRALVPRRRGKRTLSALAVAYGVGAQNDTHQADSDAELTLDLLAAMIRSYPRLGSMEATDLQDFQRESHARWASEFENYLRSQGKQTTISRQWF